MNVRRFSVLIFLVFVIPLLYLSNYNWIRAVIILLFLVVWLIISIRTKDLVLSSILYILFTLPFNITYQVTQPVLFLTSDPYANGIYTNFLVPTISIVDTGLLLLLVSGVFTYRWSGLKKIFKKYWVYFICLTLFLAYQVISTASLLVLVNSTRLIISLLSFILIRCYLKGIEQKGLIRYILWIFLINVVLQGILGVIQFERGSSLRLSFLGESQIVSGMQGSSFITLGSEVYLRAYGTFPHPNILGGFLVISLLIGIFVFRNTKGLYKWLSLSLVIASFLFVFFTFSRICISLSVLVLLVTLVSHVFKKRSFFSFSPLFVLERFENLLSFGDTSWSDRLNLIKSSFFVIKNNFLLGTGLGNFTSNMGDTVPITVSGMLLVQPVHNVLLLIVSELGILGTGLYGLMWFKAFKENSVKMSIFKWLVVVVLAVIGSFDHYLWSLPQGQVLFMIAMLLIFLPLKQKDI